MQQSKQNASAADRLEKAGEILGSALKEAESKKLISPTLRSDLEFIIDDFLFSSSGNDAEINFLMLNNNGWEPDGYEQCF